MPLPVEITQEIEGWNLPDRNNFIKYLKELELKAVERVFKYGPVEITVIQKLKEILHNSPEATMKVLGKAAIDESENAIHYMQIMKAIWQAGKYKFSDDLAKTPWSTLNRDLNALDTVDVTAGWCRTKQNNANQGETDMPERELESLLEKLKASKQVIMTGAPGTGKTFKAQGLAKELIGTSGNKNIQIGFVQFHPSFDYTDFVEGLRPVNQSRDGQMEIGFTLKNGIFKEFCRVAGVIERLKEAGLEVNDENIRLFLDGQSDEVMAFWQDADRRETPPPFVFIIDEINRAEVSKVFGELFFSIDPGYRGSAGKVSTQYANIANDQTFFTNKFNDRFFVPSNVYILASMNDIDRSVESFDFAIRRRFSWHEITAQETQDEILDSVSDNAKEEAKVRMNRLNDKIEKDLGIAWQIGGAYFQKLNDLNDDFNVLWDFHLAPLIREYLRGTSLKLDDELQEYKQIYDNSTPAKIPNLPEEDPVPQDAGEQ